ncbi:hypothetical protein BKH43_04875 [Helicobacter sp. 13S00401-1]|uniref:NYN domain-containing protein n=1 Tax=Helicobacter sp. 13S00401-1 TaxID=1905758 RepID=UPI000BA7B798|nr:NYN domain-containing protein [Helicobacter sp. 13S00401-1]PAF50242.1 hypothetical protein BKH43_04875 [Helicobacter sp. 13S00401-1]
MKKKVVIFIDWENLRKEIEKIQKDKKCMHFNKTTLNYNNATHIMALIYSFIEKDDDLQKIFFYTAPPIDMDDNMSASVEIKPRIPQYAKEFLDNIVKQPYVASRLGISKFRGFDEGGKPIFIQKQVDMLLGLDIAHVVYNKLADRILIFSKDIDLVPALKCARTQGVITLLANIKEGFDMNSELMKHSDLIRTRSCENIVSYIASKMQELQK